MNTMPAIFERRHPAYHRVLLTFEAEAEDMDSDAVITRVLDAVDVP